MSVRTKAKIFSKLAKEERVFLKEERQSTNVNKEF